MKLRSHHFARASHARRGAGAWPAFTLVELVLVIATIAVLAAIAVPRYADATARYRVELAAKRVVADLMLARSNARATSGVQVVDFASPPGGYTLPGVAAPDGAAGDYVVRLADEPYRSSVTGASFGEPAAASVRFDRYGSPDVGGTVVVTSGRYQKTVYVDAASGRAVAP